MEKEQILIQDITKEELLEMEKTQKTKLQKVLDIIISTLPFFCGILAVLEYWFVPNIRENKNPMTYVYLLLFFITLYVVFWIHGIFQLSKSKNKYFS